MKYKIQTTPIIDAFSHECECPLCQIEATNSARLVSLYLGDAVMEPDSRVEVNALGFCHHHLKALEAGENKLGLALQLYTRTAHLIEQLSLPKDAKAAVKLAKKIDQLGSSCTICKRADELMSKYYATTAQLYSCESGFRELLMASKGFCMPHFARLLENAVFAGIKTKEYLADLYIVQNRSMQKTNQNTERFTLMFDYNSNQKQFKGSENVVRHAIDRLCGSAKR